MNSFLNTQRPPVFCPGCAHDRVVRALDQTLRGMGLRENQIAIVSDIGCSGLFDTFFNTHAFHGLHGRALTYAAGIKMARPDLHVIVTMGDGGLGIGGAHLLSACRRNMGLTLLILNNFNYGMTGGQCSSTTPPEAMVGSGFLNRLEKPVDACQVAGSAGAGYTARASAYQADLSGELERAIRFDGFSVLDIWGVCPGRYSRRNKLTPAIIKESLADLPPADGPVSQNSREEYGRRYRETAASQKAAPGPARIEAEFTAPESGRQEVVILGKAGQRIVTAGEILGLAGISAGLHATQKNDYPITVLRGHSVSELVMSEKRIRYTGIERPGIILALADEGVGRRKAMLENLTGNPLVLKARGVNLPALAAEVVEIDFKAQKIKSPDWALACLAVMAKMNRGLNMDMLQAALAIRFKGAILESALALVEKAESK
ncbi:MAG: 2-oxoglutarate synthase [Desulfobacterales bacterium]|nr:2-oxoglutarate synthase [Desulfobacterales bacterium]